MFYLNILTKFFSTVQRLINLRWCRVVLYYILYTNSVLSAEHVKIINIEKGIAIYVLNKLSRPAYSFVYVCMYLEFTHLQPTWPSK